MLGHGSDSRFPGEWASRIQSDCSGSCQLAADIRGGGHRNTMAGQDLGTLSSLLLPLVMVSCKDCDT